MDHVPYWLIVSIYRALSVEDQRKVKRALGVINEEQKRQENE